MREIVSVLGLPDKPMEVTVPKDLVSGSLPLLPPPRLLRGEGRGMRVCSDVQGLIFSEYYNHVEVQVGVPIPGSVPSSGNE